MGVGEMVFAGWWPAKTFLDFLELLATRPVHVRGLVAIRCTMRCVQPVGLTKTHLGGRFFPLVGAAGAWYVVRCHGMLETGVGGR